MPVLIFIRSDIDVYEPQGDAPAASTLLKLRLAVRQPRQAEFEQIVIDISTPDHPIYGQHMKRDQMKAFLRPSDAVSQSILGWVRSEGISESDIEDDGDWINLKVTLAQAESMLDTRFYFYHNRNAGIKRIRTLQYSIPQALHGTVQMIQPTTRFGQLRPQLSMVMGSVSADSDDHPSGYNATFCNTTVTPDCLRGLYQLDDFEADPDVGNSLGISGYLEQFAQSAELQQFVNSYATYARNASFDVVSISGGLNTQTVSPLIDTGEANLDMQYGLAMSYNTPVTYYTTGGRGLLVPDLDQPSPNDNSNEPYLDQLQYLLSLDDDKLPKVLTTSYGEDEQSVPEEYSRAVCSLFAQLGSRGTSVIFASGDTGVGSACQTNDGKNTTRFLPIFPASCPFVTAVGGTQHVEPEVAVSFSSGGFSDRFPRPGYQQDAVSAYLKKLGNKWSGLYNPAGRGFPDVAAQSVNYSVYDHGAVRKYLGTS
jgi:tripeptidyl-peptidase I